jgi:hypothetical protein
VKLVDRALVLIVGAAMPTMAFAQSSATDLELYQSAYWAGNPPIACYSTDSEGRYWERLNRRLHDRLDRLRAMLATKLGNPVVASVEGEPGEVFLTGPCDSADTYRGIAEFERTVRKLERRLKPAGT